MVCISVKDKQRIGEFVNSAPADLKGIGSINFIDINRGDNEYWDVGMQKIVAAVPKTLPRPNEEKTIHVALEVCDPEQITEEYSLQVKPRTV